MLTLVTPVALVQLATTAANATGTDSIQFTQTSGNSKAYIKYVPGDGSTATTQAVTGGGGCATPTVGPAITGSTTGSSAPILGWAAGVWSNQTNYGGSRSAAVVAAYNGSTGVCALGQAWSVDNVPQPSSGNSAWGVEGLDFSVGSNPVIAGRSFSRVLLNIANNTATATTVHLVEFLGGTRVADQNCALGPTLKSNSPAIVVADTQATTGGSPCSGTDPSSTGFDTIEVQVPSSAESVSVVQTSTFYLDHKICGGQTISTSSSDGTTGNVSTSLTMNAPSSDCKTYTSFSASANSTGSSVSGSTRSVTFGATGATMPTGDHLTTTVDWGTTTYCTPSGATACAPTWVSFDGGNTFQQQTFCSSAAQSAPAGATNWWCTTSKKYSYVTVNNTLMTDITETWDGIGDPVLRSGY